MQLVWLNRATTRTFHRSGLFLKISGNRLKTIDNVLWKDISSPEKLLWLERHLEDETIESEYICPETMDISRRRPILTNIQRRRIYPGDD